MMMMTIIIIMTTTLKINSRTGWRVYTINGLPARQCCIIIFICYYFIILCSCIVIITYYNNKLFMLCSSHSRIQDVNASAPSHNKIILYYFNSCYFIVCQRVVKILLNYVTPSVQTANRARYVRGGRGGVVLNCIFCIVHVGAAMCII